MFYNIKFFVFFIFKAFLITQNTVLSSLSSPKINLLSHQVYRDQADIRVNSTVHLRCTGAQPLVWSFPNNNPVSSTLNFRFLIFFSFSMTQ